MTSVPTTTTTAAAIMDIAGTNLRGNGRRLCSSFFCSSRATVKRVQNPISGVSFRFDASKSLIRLNSFTNVTVNDVTVPGHVRANEALYIGSLTPFNKVYFNLGTASTDVCTLVYEYYNGSQWVALTNVTDNTVAFTATAGVYSLKFKAPSDWAKVVVNAGTSSYFIRVRCSAFTSAGTQGLITQGIMTLTANSDRFTRIIRGLVETDFKVIVQNATAGVAASQSIGGAGAFSGSIAVMRMI